MPPLTTSRSSSFQREPFSSAMMPAKSNTMSKLGVSSLLRKERGISVTRETALSHQRHHVIPLVATMKRLTGRDETNVQIVSDEIAWRMGRESERWSDRLTIYSKRGERWEQSKERLHRLVFKFIGCEEVRKTRCVDVKEEFGLE